MSNSSLVSYTRISPMKSSPRNHKIDSIAIHCMAGNLSLQSCGNIFQTVEASSNYGIDSNGKVALYVDERDRSWATSSSYVDNRAVTIEVANDVYGGDWHCSDAALKSLINLCVDICKRNGIKKMYWLGSRIASENFNRKDGEGVFYVHRWYASKSCPGDYLYGKHRYICDEVNKRLGSASSTTPQSTPTSSTTSRIAIGNQHAINFCGYANKAKVLQHALNLDYGSRLIEDGNFGTGSKNALGNHYVKVGEKQYMVTALEILLMMNNYDPKGVECPGVFGSGLESAVKNFQRVKNLTADGVAGRNTFLELIK